MGTKRRPVREFCLYVSYSLGDHDWGEPDKAVDEAVGKAHDGSGTGTGMRDLDYWFTSRRAVVAAAKRVEALKPKLKNLQVTFDEK